MDFRTIHNLVVVTVLTAALILTGAFVVETHLVGSQAASDSEVADDSADPCFELILDSQDDEIGIKICKVDMNTIVSLPYLYIENTSKEFVGWCPYSDGHGVIFPPSAKLMVTEKTTVLYGVWSVPGTDSE